MRVRRKEPQLAVATAGGAHGRRRLAAPGSRRRVSLSLPAHPGGLLLRRPLGGGLRHLHGLAPLPELLPLLPRAPGDQPLRPQVPGHRQLQGSLLHRRPLPAPPQGDADPEPAGRPGDHDLQPLQRHPGQPEDQGRDRVPGRLLPAPGDRLGPGHPAALRQGVGGAVLSRGVNIQELAFQYLGPGRRLGGGGAAQPAPLRALEDGRADADLPGRPEQRLPGALRSGARGRGDGLGPLLEGDPAPALAGDPGEPRLHHRGLVHRHLQPGAAVHPADGLRRRVPPRLRRRPGLDLLPDRLRHPGRWWSRSRTATSSTPASATRKGGRAKHGRRDAITHPGLDPEPAPVAAGHAGLPAPGDHLPPARLHLHRADRHRLRLPGAHLLHPGHVPEDGPGPDRPDHRLVPLRVLLDQLPPGLPGHELPPLA